MRLRRVMGRGSAELEIGVGTGWVPAAELVARLSPAPEGPVARSWSSDSVALMGAPRCVRESLARLAQDGPARHDDGVRVLLPFEPRSFRDFMIYERHAVDAARGFVERFMPRLAPVARLYERATGGTFPAFRPKPLWHRQPIYYMGNHLAFVPDGADIVRPAYTHALDWELELGIVLARPLYNASPAEAEAAIGGFVVVNDFSARDVQLAEMASGFGPQKAKHFANAMSSVVVTADEILPRWRALNGTVRLDGKLIATPPTSGSRWTLGEMLAQASRGERLWPGELLATGTLPGGSGIETGHELVPGNVIEVAIEGIGSVGNRIVAEEETAS